MELLVATWTMRITLLGMLIVGWLSWSAGLTIADVTLRVAITAAALTFAGRWFAGWLETPEQKMDRIRARHRARPNASKASDR